VFNVTWSAVDCRTQSVCTVPDVCLFSVGCHWQQIYCINCRCCCFGHTCRSVLQLPPTDVTTFEHWNYGLWPWCSRVLGVDQLSVSDEVSSFFRNIRTLYRTVPRHISERSPFLCLGVCWVHWQFRPDLQGLVFNSVPDRTSWVQLSKNEKSIFHTRYCWRCAYVTYETLTASESNRNDFGCQRVGFATAWRFEYLFARTGKWRHVSETSGCFEFMLLLAQEDFIWGFCSCGIRALRYWLLTFGDTMMVSALGRSKCAKGM
jgi:hypothetical protein